MANRELTTKYAASYFYKDTVMELAQLDTATQASEIIDLRDAPAKKVIKGALFASTVAGISTNVIVRLEGSLDKTNWFNLHAEGSNTTITANGTSSLYYDGLGDIRYIRFYWVSEAGGTAATIDNKVKFF